MPRLSQRCAPLPITPVSSTTSSSATFVSAQLARNGSRIPAAASGATSAAASAARSLVR